jgi:Uma2 family endonuclease
MVKLTIQLPERATVMASNRQHWDEVLADPRWADHPYRIESNAFGQIVMTPPPGGSHSTRQSEIAFVLRSLLKGRALCECPLSTLDGVKAIDVGWYSEERFQSVRGQTVFELAPEICVEVLSPRNTKEEMRTKRELYFEAGADECWICDLAGVMSFYLRGDSKAARTQSPLCPKFPWIIND